MRWLVKAWRFCLCLIGNHCWDYPGGPCIDCGECDEIFGQH